MPSVKRSSRFSPSSVKFNGKTIAAREMHINPFSPSFQYGLNVFEGVRGYLDSDQIVHPFLLDEHLERLESSARMMRLARGLDVIGVKNDVMQLLGQEPPKTDIYIKIMVFSNSDGTWTYSGDVDTLVFYYGLESTLRRDSPREYTSKICSFRRIDANVIPPTVKAGANYMNSRMGYFDASVPGSPSNSRLPIFLNKEGRVSESSGSCLFIAKGTRLLTPDLGSSILPSITRRFLLDFFRTAVDGVQVIEGNVERWDLYDADEIFLCGTNIEVGAVLDVDGYVIGGGNVGHFTSLAFEHLRNSVL